MKPASRLAFLLPLCAGAILSACGGQRPTQTPSAARQAPPPPRADDCARLVRSLEALKQPGVQAERTTAAARSVLDAIGGAPEMQGDAGRADH